MVFLSLIEWIILSSGWRRALVAALSGACGALALAPFDIVPAMCVPVCVAIWLLDGAAQGSGSFSFGSLRNAAVIGWFWGFGYFIAGLWWLGAAFLVEADKFAVLLPLGVIGLPALLAFFRLLALCWRGLYGHQALGVCLRWLLALACPNGCVAGSLQVFRGTSLAWR